MDTDRHIALEVQRLLSLTWTFDENKITLYRDLVYEYYRRMALWAQVLDIQPRPTWPFFDVAEFIDVDSEVHEAIWKDFEARFALPGLFSGRTCFYHLRWVTIQHTPAVIAFQLPAPYEPLIRMYELGGNFWTEQGHVQFGGASVSVAGWDLQMSRPPLDLDQI